MKQIDPMEMEIDRHIASLALLSEKAMAEANPAAAREFADEMMAAIASRTPEHVARLEREAYDRVTEQCAYFTSDAALALAQGRAA